MAAYLIESKGLEVHISEIANAGDSIQRIAARAINRTADRSRTESARRIRQEVAFPANYLNPSKGRLSVSKKAAPRSLEARVTGRFRATSLARFVKGTPRRGESVPVEVDPGHTVRLKGAFMIPLKAGSATLDTKANMGLAVRTGGKALRRSRAAKRLAPGLYLLYGPSVQQAFGVLLDNGGVEDAADYFENEFLRQLEL